LNCVWKSNFLWAWVIWKVWSVNDRRIARDCSKYFPTCETMFLFLQCAFTYFRGRIWTEKGNVCCLIYSNGVS
jgi:hypothetical protein